MRSIWTGLVIGTMLALLAGCDALVSPQHRIDRARAEIDSGQWGRAAIELRKVVQANPQNSEGWLLLARLSLDAADANGAETDISHAMHAGAHGRELDQLRIDAWLATRQPKSLIAAVEKNELSVPEPDRSIALARAYNELDQPDQALGILNPLITAHPSSAEARLAAAEALARQGKSVLALKQIDEVMASDSHSSAAPLLKGRILIARGQFPAAAEAMALALKHMPASAPVTDRATAIAGLTESRLAQGNLKAASQSEVELAKLVPDAPITQLLSARVKLARGDYLGGISDLQRLVAHDPENVQARMLLGAAQLQQGNLEQAQVNLRQVVATAPANVEARKLLASVRLKLNDPNAALQVLTPVLSEQAMDPQLYSLLGAAENRSSDPGVVLQALEKAAEAHPKDRKLQLNLAQAYLGAGRAKDALRILEATQHRSDDLRRERLLVQALGSVQGPIAASGAVGKLVAAHPKERGLLDFAALFYASQRQFNQAKALLQQVLIEDPHDIPSLLDLARIDLAANDEAGAEKVLRTAYAEKPQDPAVRVALADVLASKKSFAEAERLLQQPGGSHSGPDLSFALARIYLASGSPKQADAALDRAIATRPDQAPLVNEAGLLLLQAHRYDAALARFRKATEIAPQNATYWLNAARAQLALNQPSTARESLEKATQIQPEWLPAVSLLALIDLRDKDVQSALGRVKQLLASDPGDPAALVVAGDVERAAGQLADAESAYSEAQRRRPEAAVAVKLFQVRLAAKVSDPEQPLEQWLSRAPHDELVRMVLGSYELQRHSLADAARQFEAVIQQVPTNVVALNNLAWIYGQQHDPRAEQLAERAYKLAPDQANVNDTLGWILAGKHEIERALPILAKAAKSEAKDLEVQYHYAFALAQAGKRAEARTVLTKALASKQNFESRHAAEQLLASLKA